MVQNGMEGAIALARWLGADSCMVQGRGGNVSYKNETELSVTGSGVRLAGVSATSEFVRLDLEKVRLAINYDGSGALASKDGRERAAEGLGRAVIGSTSFEPSPSPSIETFMHALMPGVYAAHFHPVQVNALACMQGGRQHLEGILGKGFVWVPYMRPGYDVAVALSHALSEYADTHGSSPELAVMQNHGLIVSGETAREVREKTSETLDALGEWLGAGPAEARMELRQTWPFVSVVSEALGRQAVPSPLGEVNDLAHGSLYKAIIGGVLTPDQAVYCGEAPLVVEPGSDAKAVQVGAKSFRHKRGYEPRYAIVPGEGVMLTGRGLSDNVLAEEVLRAVALTHKLMLERGEPEYMPSDDARALTSGE